MPSPLPGSAQFKTFSKHVYGNETTANPYHYGHLPEITVNKDGTGTVKKHYCLGRISHEPDPCDARQPHRADGR